MFEISLLQISRIFASIAHLGGVQEVHPALLDRKVKLRVCLEDVYQVKTSRTRPQQARSRWNKTDSSTRWRDPKLLQHIWMIHLAIGTRANELKTFYFVVLSHNSNKRTLLGITNLLHNLLMHASNTQFNVFVPF